MNITEIQKRVDQLAAAMVAKGMREPSAQIWLTSHEEPQIYLKWKVGIAREYPDDRRYKFFSGDVADAIGEAQEFIASQPGLEEAKRQDFMAALGAVIDLGNKHNIDVDFLNPLTATMKRLSENVITDQRAVEAAE
ncbi:MAG: hypothetical protein KGL39_57405 [Patescibacteria group bacterium]|nr:hypothetical protein [Patescibacteria group bacterium]